MKVKHIFTVVREQDIPEEDLKDEFEAFAPILDETGEFLYGRAWGREKISVTMHYSKDGSTWTEYTA